MKQLAGKVAIVTGGARGIGAATVRHFVAQGAIVFIADVLRNEGKELERELCGATVFVEHDVRSQKSWDAVLKVVTERGLSLTTLVNNAGVVRFGTATQECSEEDYRDVIDINQLGVFLGMRNVVPAMRAAGGGSIVNVSSVAGLVGSPGLLPYVASKWAVTGMTKAAALDLGQFGIRVNSVHPGVIDTPIYHDLPTEIWTATEAATTGLASGRPATADEIAKMIAFVASDAASYSTGSAFTADGGWTAA